jgi:hypothetical protein
VLTFVPANVPLNTLGYAQNDVNMNFYKIIQLQYPSTTYDAANKGYVDAQTGGGVTFPIAVAQGGTGATTAPQGLNNLGTGTPIYGEILTPTSNPNVFTSVYYPLVNGSGYLMGDVWVGAAHLNCPDDYTVVSGAAQFTFLETPSVNPRVNYLRDVT